MTLASRYRLRSTHLNQIINPQFLNPEEQTNEKLVFGIKINQSTYSSKQNLYCLYLLLLKYGEPEHRLTMLKEVRECKQKLNLSLSQVRNMNGGSCKNLEGQNLYIESLQFLDKQLSDQIKKQTKMDKIEVENKVLGENDQNKIEDLYSAKQKQLIIKGLITLIQSRKQLVQNPEVEQKNNKQDIPKFLNKLLNIKEEIKKYYKFSVLELSCKYFEMRNISVFIEINKQAKTITYIKKHYHPSNNNQNYLDQISFSESKSSWESNSAYSQNNNYIEERGIFIEEEELGEQQLDEASKLFSPLKSTIKTQKQSFLFPKKMQGQQKVSRFDISDNNNDDEYNVNYSDSSDSGSIKYCIQQSYHVQNEYKIMNKKSYNHDENEEEKIQMCTSQTNIIIFQTNDQQDKDSSCQYINSGMTLADYQREQIES